MRRMISGKAQKYIKDLATNHPDPSAEWGGSSYTAGTGIDISEGEISIDDTVVATKTDLEDYELKADAFSGSYNDLTDKPSLATVATTGDYDDLINKPSIPAAQVQSDWSQSDNTAVDYIKNKPTIPDAVSGTNDGTNWTSLTIGQDTYGLASGGSVDIDNKTIIENQQGQLETAVGGYSETITINGPVLPKGSAGNDWDLVDSTIANYLYNNLSTNVEYDVDVSFYSEGKVVTPPYPITRAYISTTSKTSTKFGGSGALKIIANNQTHSWEFYVDISSNKIHVWPSDSWITPSSASKIAISFESESIELEDTTTIFNSINENYLPSGIIKFSNLTSGFYKESPTDISVKINKVDPIYVTTTNTGSNERQSFNVGLNYLNQTLCLDKKYPNETTATYLSTIIGGGYQQNILIDKTNVSNTSDYSNIGYINQSDIAISVAKLIINYIKNNTLPTPGTAKNASIQYEVVIRIGSGNNGRFIYIRYTIDTTDNNIVTVTRNTSATGAIFIDDFTFKLDTEEITVSPSKIYISTSEANSILNSTGDSYFSFNNPEKVKNIVQVDKKFIPLVSDIPAVPTTTDGTYVLKATVSSGVVTYTWVLEV